MARLEWDPLLETGFGDLDEQHRKVFEKLGVLLEALEEGRPNEVVVSLFSFLIDYTGRHFETEESIMEAMDYPSLEAHRSQHTRFIVEMVKMQSSFSSDGQPLPLSVRLGTKAVTWLYHHLMTTDREMARWFREQGEPQSTG